MPHSLVCGDTGQGKSTLLKIMLQDFKGEGRSVGVFDIIGDNWGPVDFFTVERDEFLDHVDANQGWVYVVDEAGETATRSEQEMKNTATRGRHAGHQFFYLAQRQQDVHKTIRAQCHHLYLFACSLTDAKQFADEWGQPALGDAYTLGPGEFYHLSKRERQKLTKYRVNFDTFYIEKLSQ